MNQLMDVDGDEVSPVRRAANKRQFVLKEDGSMDPEVKDILSVPWEREGALLDEIRKEINDETVEQAIVAGVRLLKGIESEFSPELIQKLGVELYGRPNPKLNSKAGVSYGGLTGNSGSSDEDGDGDADGPEKDASWDSDYELFEEGDKAPKVAQDSDGNDSEPDDDADDKRPSKSRKLAKKVKRLKRVSKAGEAADNDGEMSVLDEGGTVEFQVPVRKEDGTWDLSGVPSESRPFYETMISKADETQKELAEAKVMLQKADDELRHREMVEKAAAFSHVAPTDELAPILKAAASAMDEETFEKLNTLLASAEERISKGDLFTEQGRASRSDGSEKTDAYAEAVQKAAELVEKSDSPLSTDQALARVWDENPDLYSKYLFENGMGVS